jgi:hypothetical protein
MWNVGFLEVVKNMGAPAGGKEKRDWKGKDDGFLVRGDFLGNRLAPLVKYPVPAVGAAGELGVKGGYVLFAL